MRFWKDIGGRYLDRATAIQLIAHGRTGVLDGFTARSGRTYKGTLEVDTDEWRVRIHAEAWNDEAASETPEYEVNTEPLGPCPFSEDCEVVETPTQFACTTRLRSDEQQAAYREARKQAREQGLPAPEKPEKPDHPGFVLPRTVCTREITREEAIAYLQNGRTELLTDFTSRHGRPFSATLVLKDTGRHGFEFPPRGRAAEAAGEGEEPPASRPPRAPRRRKAARAKPAADAPRKVAKAGAKPKRKAAARRRKPARAARSEAE
jgi:DNA topoisomerase-3